MWVLSESFEMIEISDIRRQAKSFTSVSFIRFKHDLYLNVFCDANLSKSLLKLTR